MLLPFVEGGFELLIENKDSSRLLTRSKACHLEAKLRDFSPTSDDFDRRHTRSKTDGHDK